MDLKKEYHWKIVEKNAGENVYDFEGTICDLLEEIIKLVSLYSFEGCFDVGRNLNLEKMFEELFTKENYLIPNCWEGIYVYLLGKA